MRTTFSKEKNPEKIINSFKTEEKNLEKIISLFKTEEKNPEKEERKKNQ